MREGEKKICKLPGECVIPKEKEEARTRILSYHYTILYAYNVLH